MVFDLCFEEHRHQIWSLVVSCTLRRSGELAEALGHAWRRVLVPMVDQPKNTWSMWDKNLTLICLLTYGGSTKHVDHNRGEIYPTPKEWLWYHEEIQNLITMDTMEKGLREIKREWEWMKARVNFLRGSVMWVYVHKI